MLDERQSGLLHDILDSAKAIAHYAGGVTREAFMADSEKQDAVLRRLEIIGEAASCLSTEARARFSHLPFHKMRGMRNIIVHDYGEVDPDLVWQTIIEDIAPLIETLEAYFASVEQGVAFPNRVWERGRIALPPMARCVIL